MGRHTETSVEIFVQGDYLQPVEKRNQHEGDHHLPDGKTQHHLQVGERIGRNRPRHDTKVMPDIAAPTIAKAATYQGFSRLPVKARVRHPPSGDSRNDEKHCDIPEHGEQYGRRSHCKS